MSSLAWIDFDEAERQRAQRIMALFQERESRDELGLGAIRDSIADHLFPGTSTIQTRLRYMLFIPWILRRLEGRDVTAAQLSAEGRAMEIRLSDALKAGGETSGVIGRDAGARLQRLPSSVYWASLGAWLRRPSARRGSISIPIAIGSTTGICPATPWIWSSGKGGFTASRATPSASTSPTTMAASCGGKVPQRSIPGRRCSRPHARRHQLTPILYPIGCARGR
jgi:hypothetical protein